MSAASFLVTFAHAAWEAGAGLVALAVLFAGAAWLAAREECRERQRRARR